MTNEMQNATGGGVAAPSSTSGVQMTPNAQKEIVMTKSNPRPWLEGLDAATVARLTDEDLARLDAQYARWTDDYANSLGVDLVEFVRDSAAYQARVRQIIGPEEIELPEFASVHKFSPWDLTDDSNDCIRQVDAIYTDRGDLNATLEVDQYAISTRMDLRVHISEGTTEDPAELTRWALDLLELAGRWAEIRDGQA